MGNGKLLGVRTYTGECLAEESIKKQNTARFITEHFIGAKRMAVLRAKTTDNSGV